jgi:uncharacterized membrane protein YfhO
VRTPWERGWHASVDGAPATLLRADYFLQGVAVPAGRHVIELRYDDPAIGYGLAGSAATAVGLSVAAFIAYRRRRTTGGGADRGGVAGGGGADPRSPS